MIENHIARVLDGLNAIRYFDTVISSIAGAHQGIPHPQIVSPHLTVNALMCSSPSFPPDTSPLHTK